MVCCANCGELCPEGQSRCAECGRALPASHIVEPHPASQIVRGCTCGGNGLCLRCYFAEVEGDIAHVC